MTVPARRSRVLWLALVAVAAVVVAFVSAGSARAADPAAGLGLNQLEQFWLNDYPAATSMTTAAASLGDPLSFGSLQRMLLAKAQPDECFIGIGDTPTGLPCANGGTPKVNQAYVWGLAKAGDTLWFGTAPNVHCLVIGGYLGMTAPNQTDSWVCELGASWQVPPLPAALGDWRPPHIYTYDLKSDELTEKSPVTDPRFMTTLGLRSAGSFGGVVLFGGPSFYQGINLFAFDVKTGAYLGSQTLSAYTNIRKFLVAGNGLYTGVAKASGGGAVLRWTGDKDDPFQFAEVGQLNGDGAELAFHQGRIFVTTWPTGSHPMGVWMSPVLPFNGLNAADARDWTEVWSIDQYDPNLVNQLTTGGGALASYHGWLYWGTMHVPFLASVAHFAAYGQPSTTQEALTTLFGTHRAIAIFRGRMLGTPSQQVEVLYGNKFLPQYSPKDGWQLVPNLMHQTPKYGLAGFGNFFNNYTWSADVFKNKLFFGTMDWSYLLYDELKSFLEQANVALPETMPTFSATTFGADLWKFENTDEAASPESISGVGNYLNYGIRTMLSDKNGLYLGTANPMNLMTDPNDGKPDGGWELLQLR